MARDWFERKPLQNAAKESQLCPIILTCVKGHDGQHRTVTCFKLLKEKKKREKEKKKEY